MDEVIKQDVMNIFNFKSNRHKNLAKTQGELDFVEKFFEAVAKVVGYFETIKDLPSIDKRQKERFRKLLKDVSNRKNQVENFIDLDFGMAECKDEMERKIDKANLERKQNGDDGSLELVAQMGFCIYDDCCERADNAIALYNESKQLVDAIQIIYKHLKENLVYGDLAKEFKFLISELPSGINGNIADDYLDYYNKYFAGAESKENFQNIVNKNK